MLESVKGQLEKVRRSYAIETSERTDSSIQIIVKDMPTQGSRRKADVMTVIPPAYPQTKPSGFFIKNDDGSWSNNICFSPNTWDPDKDMLWNWIKLIERFFKDNPQ